VFKACIECGWPGGKYLWQSFSASVKYIHGNEPKVAGCLVIRAVSFRPPWIWRGTSLTHNICNIDLALRSHRAYADISLCINVSSRGQNIQAYVRTYFQHVRPLSWRYGELRPVWWKIRLTSAVLCQCISLDDINRMSSEASGCKRD
jgi:hypothetical protein